MVRWFNVSSAPKRVKHSALRPSSGSQPCTSYLGFVPEFVVCFLWATETAGNMCSGDSVDSITSISYGDSGKGLSSILIVKRKRWDITARARIGRKRKARKGASLPPLEDSSRLTVWAVLDFGLGCFSGSLWRRFSHETSLHPSSGLIEDCFLEWLRKRKSRLASAGFY